MKYRFALALVSVFLSLAISADRTASPCRGCWVAAAAAPAMDQSFGVNIHFTDPQPGEIKMIAAAGFRWVRMDFKWDLTEPGPGRYDFSPYDRLVKELAPFGLRAMFILDYGNPLYGEGAPRTESARQAFASWAVAAAQHFANRGVIWEIYNEPNNRTFWQPPNADEYAALAMAVGRAFRHAVPGEQLIGPAVGEMDFSFLESSFRAGALDSFSAVSVHPYLRANPEAVASEYARLREMITRYRPGTDGSRLIPIMSGEWGYSSVWPGMNEEKQAVMLARQFLTNAANGIPLSIWYDWRDDGPDPKDAEHHFGLVRNNYRGGPTAVCEPKPAYLAAQALLRHFSGYRFEQRLAVGSSDDYVLVFEKDNDRRIAAWTTSNPHSLMIPAAPGQFKIVNFKGEDGGRLAASQGALQIGVTASPVYLARTD
ncbi:MAG TPA: cellulase family glycosylhydrolase [Pyrinomonadaceae bacterium]|nr:cellulase family glycosylhydrolase [Pyrinomonadaceae bacterium]